VSAAYPVGGLPRAAKAAGYDPEWFGEQVDLLVAVFRTVGYAACRPIVWSPDANRPGYGRALVGAIELYAAWLAGLETIPAFVRV
jgi:hypothetical protein